MAGISVSRVTKDSNTPAMINSGTVPRNILRPLFAAICMDLERLYVPGNKSPLPIIIPAAPAIIMAEISIVPWIQMVKKEVRNKPLL